MEDLLVKLVGLGLALLVIQPLLSKLRSPLNEIPGPFLARFTDLWRFLDTYNATQVKSQQELHQKLGPAVRIGPNLVSLSDPSLLKTVYSVRGTYVKVCMFWVPVQSMASEAGKA